MMLSVATFAAAATSPQGVRVMKLGGRKDYPGRKIRNSRVDVITAFSDKAAD